jgi:hypothetical protein
MRNKINNNKKKNQTNKQTNKNKNKKSKSKQKTPPKHYKNILQFRNSSKIQMKIVKTEAKSIYAHDRVLSRQESQSSFAHEEFLE